MIKRFLNPEGHQNPFGNFTEGWIWPISGASPGEGLPCSLRSRLVSVALETQYIFWDNSSTYFDGGFQLKKYPANWNLHCRIWLEPSVQVGILVWPGEEGETGWSHTGLWWKVPIPVLISVTGHQDPNDCWGSVHDWQKQLWEDREVWYEDGHLGRWKFR